MTVPTEAEVWTEVQKRLPLHSCGKRLLAGGTAVTGPVLVCPPCSVVEAADPEWVDRLVEQVRSES